jgi:GT2 family glycosyltransferase
MRRPTVVVVNWNGGADLLDCLASVAAQTLEASEVLLVDNGSTDGSADAAAARHPTIARLDLPANPGYGAAVNAAASATSGDPLVVLNPDVTLAPEWLATVAPAFEDDPRLGVAGVKLLFPDGLVQHAGGILRRPLMLADHRRYRQPDDPTEQEPVDVDYVTGAALAIRRQCLVETGGFDERFFLYFEETDLCWRAREAGWRVRYVPRARAVHRESTVTVRDSPGYYRGYHTGRIRFALKHLAPAAVLGELVPAERARLGSVASVEELAGLRQAFLGNAERLADDPLLAARAPELRPALADALEQLAERAIATAPTSLTAEPRASPLRAAAHVEPRPFRSRLAGVARLRTAWNWMSTRWYVAPILEQQNRLNAELVAALERVEARLERLERREDVQASWLVELDRDLTALRRRLADRAR